MTESIKICYTVGELSIILAIIMVGCFTIGMTAGALMWAK